MPTGFVDPFHEIYKHVTAAIQDHEAYRNGSRSAHWIHHLVTDFEAEYGTWGTKPDYQLYFQACNCFRLRARFLYLTVCAFLHISYDLPVVMARKWPGTNYPGLLDTEAEDAFFQLNPIFPTVFLKHGRSWKVTRWEGILARTIPNPLVNPPNQILSHWTMHLRAAAWIHARRLAGLTDPELEETKRRMRKAMVAALAKVAFWRPWSPAYLSPPYEEFRYASFIPFAAIDQEQFGLGTKVSTLLVGSAALIYLMKLRSESIRHEREQAAFVQDLGDWVLHYTHIAINQKERFEEQVAPMVARIERFVKGYQDRK